MTFQESSAGEASLLPTVSTATATTSNSCFPLPTFSISGDVQAVSGAPSKLH